jgi:hypothetical protein
MGGGRLLPPAPAARCVLVTARPAVPGGWGDVFRVDGDHAAIDAAEVAT